MVEWSRPDKCDTTIALAIVGIATIARAIVVYTRKKMAAPKVAGSQLVEENLRDGPRVMTP